MKMKKNIPKGSRRKCVSSLELVVIVVVIVKLLVMDHGCGVIVVVAEVVVVPCVDVKSM